MKPMTATQAKGLLSKTVSNYGADNVPRLAAAFSFYAMLSLAPVLVMAVVAGSIILGRTHAETSMMKLAKETLGEESQVLMKSLLAQVANTGLSTVAGLISLGITFYGASNLFIQLKETAATIWGVRSDGPFFRSLIFERLAAFLMVFAFGLITLAWLVLDSWLGWLSLRYGHPSIWRYVSNAVSAVFLTGVFAVAYKMLPKGKAAWQDVWPGAIVAAIGVTACKYLLSLYFSLAGVANAYGAAGTLVVVLLWIYYASMVFFFGLEMTNTYACLYGSKKDGDPRDVKYS
jgi:membrane protein